MIRDAHILNDQNYKITHYLASIYHSVVLMPNLRLCLPFSYPFEECFITIIYLTSNKTFEDATAHDQSDWEHFPMITNLISLAKPN